jgi:hypothetical protein
VYSEAGKWMWEHRDTKRDYDTGQLASHCIGLLLDHIAAD